VLKLQSPARAPFVYGALTRSGRGFHRVRLGGGVAVGGQGPSPTGLPTPLAQRPLPMRATGLGSSRVAHHYYGYFGCFLFLGVLRCFSSPGSPPAPMDSGLGA